MSGLKWAFLAWMVISPLVVVNLYPVRSAGIYLGVALLGLLLTAVGLAVLGQRRLLPWRSRLLVPSVALAAAIAIAGVQGALLYDSDVVGKHRFALVQIYAVALMEMSILTAFAVAVLVRTGDDVRWLRRAMIATGVLLLASVRLGLPLPVVPWWPMAAAHALSMALAWVLYERGSWWGRAAAVAFVLGLLTHVVIVPFFADVKAQWLSGWIVVSVPIGLLLLSRFPRTALGIAVPAVAFFFYWKFDLVLRVYDLAEREGDFTRFTLWLDAIDLMARRPLFGVGPGNYLDYNLRYGTIGMSMSSPHGNYQQLAAETGLVGLGFALWLFYRALALGWSLFRRTRDPLVRSLAIAATCSLSAQLTAAVVGDFVLPSYHNGGYQLVTSTIYAFVAMGLLISLERLDAGPARDG